MKLVISAKAAANGNIYGSVNAARIAEELVKLGHNIDRKIIDIEAIKTVGSHTAVVRFLRDVSADVEVEVVAETEE